MANGVEVGRSSKRSGFAEAPVMLATQKEKSRECCQSIDLDSWTVERLPLTFRHTFVQNVGSAPDIRLWRKDLLFRVNSIEQLCPSLLERFGGFPGMLGISKPEPDQVAPAMKIVSFLSTGIESIANLLLLCIIFERIASMEDS